MATCYTRTTNFTVKDTLPTEDPDKTVLGEELQFEFDAIADCLDQKLSKNNPASTGDVTNAGTVTNTGAVTNNGTVTNNGATNLDGDVFVDGETLENYITTVAETGSGPSSDGKHRYWRIGFGGSVSASAQISDGSIWTGGQGFKNGRRWNKGSQLTLPTDNANWTPYTENGGSTTPSAFAWKQFFTEGNTSVSLGYTSTPPAEDARSGVEIDFGEGNEVHISGIDINGRTSGTVETVDIVEFAYSDDGSSWTVASTVSDIKERTGADSDPSIDLPHIGNIGDTTPNTLFDKDKNTIPEVDTGAGGGAYWTFDYTAKTAGFTAADGTYYFVKGTDVQGGTITLPAGTDGARVGFCWADTTMGAGRAEFRIDDASSSVVAFVGAKEATTYPSAIFDQGNFITNIELVYADGAWNVMNVFMYTYVA